MPRPKGLKGAIAAARKADKALAREFDRLGTQAHPRGVILTQYRATGQAVAAAYDPDAAPLVRYAAIAPVLSTHRTAVGALVEESLQNGVAIGQASAEEHLLALGLRAVPGPSGVALVSAEYTAGRTAVLGEVDKQNAAALGLIASGAGLSQVVGDRRRAGVLLPSLVTAGLVVWGARLASAVVSKTLDRQPEKLYKIAVATLDDRTTETCTLVNGQVQPVDKPFRLQGTPRFADEVDLPPFHHRCRTQVAYTTEAPEQTLVARLIQ